MQFVGDIFLGNEFMVLAKGVLGAGVFGNGEGNVFFDLSAQLASRQKEQDNKERTTVDQLLQGFRKQFANIGEMRILPKRIRLK